MTGCRTLVRLARPTRERGVGESAAGDVEAGPDTAAPADLDRAGAALQLQQDVLPRLQFAAMEEAQPAARDVGREHFALDGLILRRGGGRKDHGAGPSAKGHARELAVVWAAGWGAGLLGLEERVDHFLGDAHA